MTTRCSQFLFGTIAIVIAGKGDASAATIESLLSLCLSGSNVVDPDRLWENWSLAPEVVGPLVLLAAGYAFVVLPKAAAGESGLRTAFFSAGYLLLLVALISPLCRIAAALASMHMVQHVLLVTAAPALIALGMPERLRIRMPPLGLSGAAYGAIIWFWHVPAFYDAALTNAPAHLAMYASLISISLLFWRGIADAARSAAGCARALFILLATLIHTGMLGALLSFSPSIWYPTIAASAPVWGFAPLEDQQLAGLIMWIPMGFIYLAAATALAYRGLATFESAPHTRADITAR